MKYNFPPTKFVRENTAAKQLRHVISEIKEVQAELIGMEDWSRVDIELGDLWHSIETYFRILEKNNGQYAYRVMAEIDKKNRVRGYYEEE